MRTYLVKIAKAAWHSMQGGALALPLLTGAAWAQDIQVLEYEGLDQLPDIQLTDSEGQAPMKGVASAQDMIDYVTAASKGKITIMPYFGSLMNIIETPEGVASGVADIGGTLPVYTPADYPITNWINSITNQLKGGQPYGKLVTIGANAEFWATNAELKKEYADRGLHILGANGGTAYDLLCTERVSNLAEAKGKATRTANQAVAKEVESMGFASVSVVVNELYEAFSRGIVKCIYLFPAGYVGQGLMDVPTKKYWIHLDLSGWMASVQVFNKAKWDSLPPLAQQILTDGYVYWLQRDAYTTYMNTRAFGEYIKKGEVEAVQPDAAMLDTLHKHQQQVLAEMATTDVPPGIENPQAIIDQYLGLLAKWRKIVGEELKIPDTPVNATDVVDAWFIDYDFAPFQKRLSEELAKARAS